MKKLHLLRDDRGAAIVEMAFALPAFIMLLWSMVQLGLVYRANSGIQHALGQGARFATLYPTPTDDRITAKMNEAVYGIGPGHFETLVTDVSASGYKDLKVTYSQPTDLLLFPGPVIKVVKQKRVWVASATGAIPDGGTDGGTDTGTGGGTGTDSGTGGTGTGTGTDGGTGGTTTTPPPTTTEPPPTTTTPPPTTTTPSTGNNGNGNSNGNGNGNGNGNTECKKKNGKAC